MTPQELHALTGRQTAQVIGIPLAIIAAAILSDPTGGPVVFEALAGFARWLVTW